MIKKAQKFYEPYNIDFEMEVLPPYIHHGYVISSPDMLMLFRPSKVDNADSWFNPHPDCWFVEIAFGAGRMIDMIKAMPYKLPKVCFYRGFKNVDDKLRVYDTNRILSFTG
jgi:hypothetical protein